MRVVQVDCCPVGEASHGLRSHEVHDYRVCDRVGRCTSPVPRTLLRLLHGRILPRQRWVNTQTYNYSLQIYTVSRYTHAPGLKVDLEIFETLKNGVMSYDLEKDQVKN